VLLGSVARFPLVALIQVRDAGVFRRRRTKLTGIQRFDEMRVSDLRNVGGPAIVRYVATAPQTYELAWKIAAGGFRSRILRGNKMRRLSALFD
jgi:hypothetical protein